MNVEYDMDLYEKEMSVVIKDIWSANMGECPHTPIKLRGYDWDETGFYMPLSYISTAGEDAYQGESAEFRAGVRLKQASESLGMVEMLTDMKVLMDVSIDMRPDHLPMLSASCYFPSNDHLDLSSDQYRLLTGSSMISWIHVHMMPNYRLQVSRILNETARILIDKGVTPDIPQDSPTGVIKH